VRIQKSLSNAIIYSGMLFLQKAISFLMLPVYTAILSPGELGIVNMVVSIGSFFILLFNYALDEAAVRFYFENRTNIYLSKKIVGTIVCLSLLICSIGGVTLFLFKDFIYKYFIPDISLGLIILSIIIVITSPIFSIHQKLLRIKERAKEYVISSFSYSMMQITFTLIFVMGLGMSSFGYLLAMTITSFIAFVCSLFFIRKDVKFVIENKMAIAALKYSTPIVPHTISSWGLSNFTQVFLGRMKSSITVGVFTAMSFSGTIVQVLFMSLINTWQPWLYAKMDNHDYLSIKKLSKVILLIFITVGFLLSLFSKEIAMLVINSRYHSSIIIVPFIIVSNLFMVVGGLYVFVLYYEKASTKYIFYSTLAGVIVNILLSIILIPVYGILGATIAIAIANLIISLLRQVTVSKILKQQVYTFDIYLIILLNLLASVFAIKLDFSFLFKSYMLLVDTFIIIFLYKNLLKSYINKSFN